MKAIRFGFTVSAVLLAVITHAPLAPPAWGDGGGEPTRSTTIALTQSGNLLFTVNHDANSVTVFRVDQGGDVLKKLDEVPVGREPECVAVRQEEAFVTNSASGTVSVISKVADRFRVVAEIPVP